MMTSVYQAAPPQDQVNGGGGGNKAVAEEAKAVPGTSLKCLEDPQFCFDGGADAVPPPPLPKPRKPTYKGWVFLSRFAYSLFQHQMFVTLTHSRHFQSFL